MEAVLFDRRRALQPPLVSDAMPVQNLGDDVLGRFLLKDQRSMLTGRHPHRGPDLDLVEVSFAGGVGQVAETGPFLGETGNDPRKNPVIGQFLAAFDHDLGLGVEHVGEFEPLFLTFDFGADGIKLGNGLVHRQ